MSSEANKYYKPYVLGVMINRKRNILGVMLKTFISCSGNGFELIFE